MVKKQIKNRIIAFCTALAMSFSVLVLFEPFKAFALNDTRKEYYDEALIEELSVIEPVKENYGLKGVNFSELYTSEKIPVYEYTKGGIVKTGQVLPVYYQGQMKLLMYEVENNRYQAVAVPKGVNVDSECGYLTSSITSSQFTYYNPYSGKTMTLNKTICKNW